MNRLSIEHRLIEGLDIYRVELNLHQITLGYWTKRMLEEAQHDLAEVSKDQSMTWFLPECVSLDQAIEYARKDLDR